MSEFDDIIEDEITCPYCRYEFQDGFEFSDEGVQDCYNCGKKFHYTRDVTIQYSSTPDCELNKLDHVWKPHTLRGGKTHDFCEVCGKIKPFTPRG